MPTSTDDTGRPSFWAPVTPLSSVELRLPGKSPVSLHLYGTRLQEPRVCTVFSLPPPTNALWHKFSRTVLFAESELVARAIAHAVSEHVIAHAQVTRATSPALRHSDDVVPYPPGQGVTYLFRFAVTPDDVERVNEYAELCATCDYRYAEHADEICPGHLGESFASTMAMSVDLFVRMLEFSKSLSTWLNSQSDAIYQVALEKLREARKSEATPYVGEHARGGFAPYNVGVPGESLGASTTSDGPSNTVSGEPRPYGRG